MESDSELWNFAVGYFNQDFEDIHGEPDEVIVAFRHSASDTEVTRLLGEITDVLTDKLTEAELGGLWLESLHSSYDPAEDGYSYRAWFEHVRDMLTSD